MESNVGVLLKILSAIRTTVITLISWAIGTCVKNQWLPKFSVTVLIAIFAVLLHIILEIIIYIFSKYHTKISILFGVKNKHFNSEFKLVDSHFVDDVAKISIKITIEGSIKRVSRDWIKIALPERTLFTLEADKEDQGGKTLDFEVDDSANVLWIKMPKGVQKNARFSYLVFIRLTKNTTPINFENGSTVGITAGINEKAKKWYQFSNLNVQLSWNRLSADTE